MIKFKKTTETAKLPRRTTDGAAGFDLYYNGYPFSLEPGKRAVLETGISMEMAPYVYGQIKCRSSYAAKYGLDVLAGVLDSDYRGEVKVIMINHGDEAVHFRPGDRFAQIVFLSIHTTATEVTRLTKTERNDGAMGSTGIK